MERTCKVQLEGLFTIPLHTRSHSPCSPFLLPSFGLVGKSCFRVSGGEPSLVIFFLFCIICNIPHS